MADSTRPDPFRYVGREFGSLRIALDRLVSDSLLRRSLFEQGGLDVDVYERDGKTVVEASLPGYTRDEIEVRLDEGVLSIRAEHHEAQEQLARNYYRRERRFGAASRRLPLPGVASDAQVDAQFRDGVLRIAIDPATGRPSKSIEVKDG
jgi:HSP20 family protein